MAKEEYEHQFNRETGVSHLTGKIRRAKSDALKKKREPSERQKRFSKYLKSHPPGTMKGDRKAMFEHNRQEYDTKDYD